MNSGSRHCGAILIVEDDEHMRSLLATLARELGFQRTLEAVDIPAALQTLELDTIDMAIIDLGSHDGMAVHSRHSQPRVGKHSSHAYCGGVTIRHEDAYFGGRRRRRRRIYSQANFDREFLSSGLARIRQAHALAQIPG